MRKLSFQAGSSACGDILSPRDQECRAPARPDGSLQSGRSPTFILVSDLEVETSIVYQIGKAELSQLYLDAFNLLVFRVFVESFIRIFVEVLMR